VEDDELRAVSAVEQAELVRRREVSPTELLTCYLDRIEAVDPGLGAFLTVDADGALRAAKAAEHVPDDTPPFHGVPIAIKDLSRTAGLRTTMGSGLLADHVPDADDLMVARLRAAGFVILGKTNTPEFGWSFVTEPPAFRPARNPWDLGRTPGGSSGGSAAAVAAGLAPIAQGSDAGGSIRVPSSVCGLVGFKPSRGRVSAAPEPNRLSWQDGPLARTVTDAAALLDVIAGGAPGDAWSQPDFDRPLTEEVGAPAGRLRVGLVDGAGMAADANSAAARGVAALLEELGHDVEEAAFPVPPEARDPDAWLGHSGCDFLSSLGPLADLAIANLDRLDPVNRLLAEHGLRTPVPDYLRAEYELQRSLRDVAGWFDPFDVLIMPTVAQPPLPIGAGRAEGARATIEAWLAFSPFTSIWNATGQPAISLPVARDDSGLPVGVQVVGRVGAEALLVRVASAIEQARPWQHPRTQGMIEPGTLATEPA